MFKDIGKICKSGVSGAFNSFLVNTLVFMLMFIFWLFFMYTKITYTGDIQFGLFEEIIFWVLGFAIIEVFKVVNKVIINYYKI